MSGADLMKAAAGALAGAVLGWGAQSFKVEGELRGVVKTLERIESRLDKLEVRKP